MKPILVVLLLAGSLLAADTKAPLPDALLKAKTVYIDNQSGSQKFADEVYSELSKWKRFSVSTDASNSDIRLRLVCHHGQVNNNPCHAAEMIALDVTGSVLWSNTHNWGIGTNGPKKLVNDLRNRLGN